MAFPYLPGKDPREQKPLVNPALTQSKISSSTSSMGGGNKTSTIAGQIAAPAIDKFGLPTSTKSYTTIPSGVGVQATSPYNNIGLGKNTIPESQVKVSTTPAPQSTSGGTSGGSNYSSPSSAPIIKSSAPSPSSGVGIKAPQGMEYGANGQLQPVTASTSQTGQNQGGYTVNNGLYGQLITGLANRSTQPSAEYLAATKYGQDVNDQMAQLQQNYAQQTSNLEGSPIDLSLATGQQGILNRLFASKQAALAGKLGYAGTQLGAANTQQGLQQSGLTSAAGLAAPQQVSYGSQYLNPATGQPMGGGSFSGQGGNFIEDLASQVSQGTAYNDAVAQLPNAAMAPMLLQAIRAQNPNFDITQSNQNAQARNAALQQSATTVRPMVNSFNTAIQHLDNLQGVINDVNYSNAPLWNSLREGWSDRVQSNPNIRKLQSEIGIIRSEVAKVLGGGTVTVESLREAQQVVPDKISPEQFQQVKDNILELMQSKIEQSQNLETQQYGQSNNTTNATTNTGAIDWANI